MIKLKVQKNPQAELFGKFIYEDVKANSEVELWKKTHKFTAKLAETWVSGNIVYIGLGKKDKLTLDKIREASASAVKIAQKLKSKSLAVDLPDFSAATEEILTALFEGAYLAAYKFKGLKKPEEKEAPKLETFIVSGLVGYENLIKKQMLLQEMVNRTKDLVNLPANIVTPSYLEKIARKIGKLPKVKCTVFSYAQAKQKGFGGFCAVAQGSEQPPKFIILEYKNGGKAEKIALIGKGITFDSGGISLKPASGMHEMKTDMAGAAVVLGAFEALVRLKVRKNLICITPLTENMPSGKAYKPGDVITTYKGRTVEINSTDAEGRMIICDALTYAQELGAKKLIDFATLTGACLIALGQTRAGVMTNDQKFLNDYLAAAEKTGEKHWQLPMDDEYDDLLKSSVADTFNNPETRYAGTIVAGKFLEKFIEEGNSWIHCDIAGTAFISKPQRYLAKEATGFGVRTLVEWLG